MTDQPNQYGLKPSPAGAWRKQTYLVTLPGGNTALLKKPDLLNLIAGEDVPDLLSGIVQKHTQPNAPAQPLEIEVTPDTMPQILEMCNVVCRAAFVTPQIVANPREGMEEISLDDIDFNDKVFVLRWSFGAQGVAAQQFPQTPLAGAGAVPDGK